jgi:hypothetical protein
MGIKPDARGPGPITATQGQSEVASRNRNADAGTLGRHFDAAERNLDRGSVVSRLCSSIGGGKGQGIHRAGSGDPEA